MARCGARTTDGSRCRRPLNGGRCPDHGTTVGPIQLLHGTSAARASLIAAHGLHDPFLTDDPEQADYYAEVAAEEDGTDPVVIEVEVDPAQLRYDRAAMDEPVCADDADRDRAREQAARDHPEWVHNGYLSVPADQWHVSLDAVHAVRADGAVPVADTD